MNLERSPFSPRNAALILALILTAILLPIALWNSDLPFISNTYGKDPELFELFGFSASVALIATAFVSLKPFRRRSVVDIVPLFLFFVVGFHFLTQIVEYSAQSWDYNCYQSAAQRLIQGANPYTATPEECYLYPPLLAQVLALAHGAISSDTGLFKSEGAVWHVVFYLYQSVQFLSLLLVYFLCYRFARLLDIPPTIAALLVAGLLLVNNPLVRTLRHNQVNLWMLNLILMAILWLPTRPFIAGVTVALGTHLKLFALALIPIWILDRRWRGTVGAISGLVVIALLQTNIGQSAEIWGWFSDFYSQHSLLGLVRYRNSSIRSIVFGSLRTLRLSDLLDNATVQGLANVLVISLTLFFLAWMAARFRQREKLFADNSRRLPASNLQHQNQMRLIGHSLDMMALILIAAPVTWEHHYVLAMPHVLWAAATQYERSFWLLVISVLLMFVVPTFDIFPVSYHRFIGLLIWIHLSSPWVTQRAR